MYVYLFVLSPVIPQLSSAQVTVCGVAIREWQHTIVIITGTLHIGALLEPLLLFKWGQPKYTQVRNSIQLNKCGKGTNIDTAEDFLRVYMVCTPYLFYPFLLSIMPVTPYVSSHYFCIKIPRNRY